MISQFFIDLFVQIVSWLADLFPSDVIPDNVQHPDAQLGGLFGLVTGLGVWVNWPVVNACALVALGAYGAGLSIAIVRVIISHLPFVGGK
jgi:hypothetical protein